MSELKEPNQKDFEAVVMIELARIYDLLSVVAHAADPERTDALFKLHERGKIMAPPPAIEIGDTNGYNAEKQDQG